jgi:CxxC motif-containing protein (DUF1111 family)
MLRQHRILILAIGLALLAGAIAIVRNTNLPIARKSSGAEFFYDANHSSFSHPAPALNAIQRQTFNLGNRIFNTNWVPAADAPNGFDGLGPLYNRKSCASCHVRDGRGQPTNDAALSSAHQPLSMLIRISIPGNAAHGAPKPVPGYGLQINDQALPGLAPEASVALIWQEIPGTYGDGEKFSLRAPTIKLRNPGYGALPSNVLSSARVAPAVFGLGLIEALSDATILALADPNDLNQDGISGRANMVYSRQMRVIAVGRYGWKANVATLTDQTLDAALFDIGLTSAQYPQQNCEVEQIACTQATSDGNPELSPAFTEKLTRYVQMLGVPKTRPSTDESTRGEVLFREFQCAACHVDTLTTSTHSSLSYLRNQVFHPYTDLLLHDMGEGLSDNRPDFAASGAEWRTAPLWGIGLIPDINGHSFYLHDGRARGIAEAILWHGGEAQSAKERFRNAGSADRKALIAFVNRL